MTTKKRVCRRHLIRVLNQLHDPSDSKNIFRSSIMLDKFRELCGDCGGYEGDFMFVCAFISNMEPQLKSPQWTFIGLRTAFNLPVHDTTLRDIMRRCFVLSGRNIIGGVDDANDSRMDRAISRLLSDRELEASILFCEDSLPDMSAGFLSLSTDTRLRVVRFIMQSVFETPHFSINNTDHLRNAHAGTDADGNRYYVLHDTSLEVGCWKESQGTYQVELVATSTDDIALLATRLKSGVYLPDRSRNACVYCRKKTSESDIQCMGCGECPCHFKCMPASELDGLQWVCSADCRQVHLSNFLAAFVAEIEPQQKAVMRKRRRLAGEIHALQINSKDYQTETLRRSSRERRAVIQPDYSFRDYEKSMSQAIRRSERKSDYASSQEEAIHVPSSRPLTREERMALREKKQEAMNPHVQTQGSIESDEIDYDEDDAASYRPNEQSDYDGGAVTDEDDVVEDHASYGEAIDHVDCTDEEPRLRSEVTVDHNPPHAEVVGYHLS